VPRRVALITAVVVAGLLVAACGGSKSATATATTAPGAGQGGATGTTANAPRVIDVTMANLMFNPSQINVKTGETVRFVFHNQDALTHEAVIGTAAEQDAHEKEMLSMSPDMVMQDTPTEITVDAGKTGQLTYTFKTPGQLLIGCHEPGHYAAGMKIQINVT
jgi:uncharacterized cupredoxin-like copper-binding protein